MTIYEYGNPDADTVLIQLTGDHELSVLKNEVEEMKTLVMVLSGHWSRF